MNEIVAGDNITVTKDPETGNLIVSAPTLNQSSIKNGEFILRGDTIEIEAGRGIKIDTAMPNHLKISIDINRQIVEIEDLKTRFNNLEQVVLGMVKNA